MRKALGLLAWTTVAAAGLWSVLPQGTTRPASADTPLSRDSSLTTPVADSRGSLISRVNPFTRSSKKDAKKEASYREAATKLLDEARDLASRGDVAGARRLAERARSFPVEWAPHERSPEKLLAQLDARSGRATQAATMIAAKPQSVPAATTPAAPAVTDDENVTAEFATSLAKKPARAAIAQVSNETAEEPAIDDEPVMDEEPAPLPKRPSRPAANAPSTAEKAAQAKSLLQQARREIANGDFDAAREMAEQAKSLNVAYRVFDERPEQILAEIDRHENNAFESAPKTRQIAQAPKAALKETPSEDSLFEETDDKANMLADRDNESPFAEEAMDDAAADSGEIAVAQNDKQIAQQLLTQAQAAIKGGDFERARSLALEAQDLDVAYGLFELQPQHVIAQVDRASNNLTIAKSKTKSLTSDLAAAKPLSKPTSSKGLPDEGVPSPFAPSDNDTPQVAKNAVSKAASNAKSPASNLADLPFDETTDVAESAKSVEDNATKQVRQRAMTGLQQARREMQAGRLEAAREKVLAVQKLNATFGLWDDHPEALLEEIDRLAQTEQVDPPKKTIPTESKTRAMALVKQARADLDAGRLDAARQKAEQAASMNVAFGVFEDRPDNILNAIQRASHYTVGVPPAPEESEETPKPATQVARQPASKSLPEPAKLTTSNPVTIQPELESIPSTEAEVATAAEDEPAVAEVVHPQGPSAEQLFREGQIHLQSNNRAAAYQAFLRAYQSGQKLDARRQQQLQTYLRELNPRRGKNIQLTGGNQNNALSPDALSADETTEPDALSPQRPLDIADQRQKVQLDQIRNEVLNAVFRAERLKEKEPAKAIEILDQAMANIEGATLDKQLTAPLAASLRKSRASIESFQKQMEPNIALNKQNADVKQTIKSELATKVRVEREYANLVKEYNELMKQRRYAEAEVVAKQAEDLDPDNPVSQTLKFKALFARRNDSNDKLRDAKEDGFWSALDSVEWSAVPFDDRNPIRFPNVKDWEDIKSRRNGKYGTDSRIRTPEEQRIESSLTRQISLHFENAPLKQVIEHIATVADVNVMLDKAGLEDESLTVSTPVSINVDGIQLKSALMLMLEPLNLGYTIKHEVLQITSDQRLQGQLMPITYSVADLVVPIQPNQSASPFASIDNTPRGSLVGGQMSVPSTGGLQGGQFQVAGAMSGGASPWLANSSPQWQVNGNGGKNDFRELIDLITTTCEPNSWEEVGGGGQIKGNDSTLSLVIRQTQKVHDEIRDLLEQLRRLQDLQVTIEVRFISVADRFFERIGIDFDFDIQDSLGGPDLYSGSTGQQGQQGGQGGQQQQQGSLIPIPPFGSIIPGGGQQQQGQQQQGQQGQQGQQAQQGQAGGNFFASQPQREFTDRDSYQKGGVILGMGSSQSFTEDNDIAFRQGSFSIGVPDFGRFDANAGMNIGFAILSDIETFFFINAAQGDRRSNIMSAPKVTLFNGQTASVFDGQQRPFVTSLIPVVGAFAVGYQPQLTVIPDGVGMSVTAVISADRRFVRLSVTPFIQQIVDIVAFSFVSAGTGGQQGQQGGGQVGGGQGGVGGQGGLGGIGGGPGMESGGMYNHGAFGRAFGSDEDSQFVGVGFGGIGQGGVGGGQFGQGGGGGQQGQQGFQAAGAGDVSVQLPVLATTQVGTVVSVPDGGTVLLGGVKRLRESRNMAGVPILNKIPYISRLFKNTGVGRETDSLMLMVTPRIVILEEEEALLGIPE